MLAELSTPVTQLWDGILLLSLLFVILGMVGIFGVLLDHKSELLKRMPKNIMDGYTEKDDKQSPVDQ